MVSVAVVDGALESAETAAVSVLDRGFLLGDGVFEVLRTYGGAPFALDEHVARLVRGAASIGLTLSVSAETLAEDVRGALRSAANDESYVRVVLTRGRGPLGLDASGAGPATRVVLVARLLHPSVELYRDGIAVALVAGTPPPDLGVLRGVKTIGYLASVVARRAADAVGAADAIFVGPGGELLEATAANLFVVRGGRVLTPPASAGILPGVTRAHVIGAARESGTEVAEHVLFPRDLYDAEEAFLTSSIREVVPVVRADGSPIGTGRPGPITQRLTHAFRHRVASRI